MKEQSIMRALRRVALALAAGALIPLAAAQEAPDAQVKRVSEDVIATIKADPKIQAGDAARIREVMDTKLVPNFDFAKMTALAMGRNWRTATPEQQQKLTSEFQMLLVRTYSSALTRYRDEKIEYRPLRSQPTEVDVTVRTSVIKAGGGTPIPMDYSMVKTDSGWKVYDVIVGGVSLVTNYRDEFNEQIKKGGVDGLIDVLAKKNGNAAAAK